MLFKKGMRSVDFSNRDIKRAFVSGLMIGVSAVFIINGVKEMVLSVFS